MKRPQYRRAAAHLIVAGLVALAAARFPRDVISAEPPEDDGFWKTAEPATLGLDVAALERHREHAEKTGADAVLVVYKDRIVDEWYSPRYREPIGTMSSVKSWTGLLVGMLIADGKIDSIDDPVSQYLPDWAEGDKAKVTLRHLLTMSSGLKKRVGKEPGDDQSVGFVGDKNPFVRALPLTYKPGSRYDYSNEGAQLLSPILDKAAGQPIQDYAHDRLFTPLGMAHTHLYLDLAGHAWTYADAQTTLRDFARVGLLMLHGGRWGDKQIVPADWVRDSTRPSPMNSGYGYLWWLFEDPPGFASRGYMDTNCYVFPSLNLVVARLQKRHSDDQPEPDYERKALELFKQFVPVAHATAEPPEGDGFRKTAGPAIETIRRKAAESHSDAVLIFKDDKPVLEWYADGKPTGPIELMSCTKSIVSIAIGRLIDTGKIKSLDQPVCDYYPEWKQGKKRLITIRHLLNHTSGLQNVPNTTAEIYPSPDFVKLALAAELADEPGSKFSYNNKAVNLLAGIVKLASGQRLDEYCRDELFRPMDITEYDWMLDGAGNPHGMAGLKLTAKDFAKFGQLIVHKGEWNGTRIVSEKWIEDSLAPGQSLQPACGLLWWRLQNATPPGFNANGYLGQYLVIYPDQRLVAVRQIRSNPKYNEKTDGFNDFMELVRLVAAEQAEADKQEKPPVDRDGAASELAELDRRIAFGEKELSELKRKAAALRDARQNASRKKTEPTQVGPDVLDRRGVSAKTIETIRAKAAESHSDAVLIFQDDQPLLEWYADGKPTGPIGLMSCTKSIVSIAIGRLIDTGKIKSLDQPVCDYYPEWKQGKKQLITIRHLLNHTSGLQNVRDFRVEILPSPDTVQLALAAELADEPGTRFSYNNKAVNLLAGIVKLASGQSLDEYCRDELFRPMGISEYNWALDSAGNPYGSGGLSLTAKDFAKFGKLVLDKGEWNGTRIVSEKWIEDSLAPGQPLQPACGLLWWRLLDVTRIVIEDAKLKELEFAGVEKDFLEKVTPLANRVFDSWEEYSKALTEVLGADYRTIIAEKMAEKNTSLSRITFGKAFGFNANGDLGQYLVIYPEQRLVAVRQIRSNQNYNHETDGFNDFMELVRLVGQETTKK